MKPNQSYSITLKEINEIKICSLFKMQKSGENNRKLKTNSKIIKERNSYYM